MLTRQGMEERMAMISTMRWDLASFLGYAVDCQTILRQAAELARDPDMAQQMRQMADDLEPIKEAASAIHARFIADIWEPANQKRGSKTNA